MQALSNEMADSSQDPSVRSQAGIQLKNCLMSRDDAETKRRHDTWRGFPEQTKAFIKQRVGLTPGVCVALLKHKIGTRTSFVRNPHPQGMLDAGRQIHAHRTVV